MKLQFHAYANIFPMMSEEEFSSLTEDIRQNGYDSSLPVMLFQDKILDGRNRYAACQELGYEPTFTNFEGDESEALDYVIRLNLHRRQLNETQRGVVASRLANMSQGERTDLEPSANLQKVSQSAAASMLSVSPRTVATVKAVEKAAPEQRSCLRTKKTAESQVSAWMP